MAYRYILPILVAVGGCAADQSVGCDATKAVQVPLQPIGQVFTAPVNVNGHELRLLLDTGANQTMLTASAVQRWGIPQSGRTYGIVIGTAGGSMRADADIESVTLGGDVIPISHLVVNSFGDNVDGLLGLDILGKYDLDIDGPHRTLGLHHTYCTTGPFWPSASLVEGTRKNDWLQMPMEIDGVTIMAVVDTGASYTMIRSPTMRRLGLTENAIATDRTFRMSIVAGDDAQARVHKFQTIRLGPVTAHDASILVLPGEPPSLYGGRQMPDAIVGQDLLRNRRVWFSWSTGRLYLSFGGPRT